MIGSHPSANRKSLHKGESRTGRPRYDCLVLFRIELFRVWYGLSGGGVGGQVNDRISFSRFAGLSMDDEVPDSTTVCRFRNILVESDLYGSLPDEINRQLEVKGVLVKAQHIMESTAYDLYRTPGILVSHCIQ